MKYFYVKMIFLISFLVFCLSPVNRASSNEVQSSELIKLKTRDSVTLKFAFITPENPVAAVIFFKGGKGIFKLNSFFGKLGAAEGKKLFELIKGDFASKGLVVVVVDVPSDNPKGISPFFRISDEHAEDIDVVVSEVVKTRNLPVWLFGHSFGTISATHGVLHSQASISGLVLASPVTQIVSDWGKIFDSNPNGIIDMDLDKIQIPTLIVYHENDKCIGTPPSNIPKLEKAIKSCDIVVLKGGKPTKSKPCGPLSPHSFFGIEREAFLSIADFIVSKSK